LCKSFIYVKQLPIQLTFVNLKPSLSGFTSITVALQHMREIKISAPHDIGLAAQNYVLLLTMAVMSSTAR